MAQAIRPGLYAITDPGLIPERSLLDAVSQAIAGGATVVQCRDKDPSPAARLRRAEQLVALCSEHAVPLIINDDVELARYLGAAGVHLGKDDITLTDARARLGEDAIIGVSCYNDYARADVAATQGADYVAFGRFFSSATKPQAVQADVRLLQQAKQHLDIPVVAIGGITPANGGELVKAGADLLAVIHGLFGEKDICRAAQRYTALFGSATEKNTLSVSA
jgi:thiamine-phosphate pyrophosphorylase